MEKKEKKAEWKRVWLRLAEMYIKYRVEKAKAEKYIKKYDRLCKKYWELYDKATDNEIVDREWEQYSTTPPFED